MIYENPIGIIELGNINIKCLILKINNDNSSEILSTSIALSEGIHNGVIVNLKKAPVSEKNGKEKETKKN